MGISQEEELIARRVCMCSVSLDAAKACCIHSHTLIHVLGPCHPLLSSVSVDILLTVRFSNLMVEKYCLVELINWVKNNVMLWNWVFYSNFIEIWFTCCKIYPFESVQFSGFPYIHKDLQSSLIPSFRRNPLFISSHSHFSTAPSPWHCYSTLCSFIWLLWTLHINGII